MDAKEVDVAKDAATAAVVVVVNVANVRGVVLKRLGGKGGEDVNVFSSSLLLTAFKLGAAWQTPDSGTVELGIAVVANTVVVGTRLNRVSPGMETAVPLFISETAAVAIVGAAAFAVGDAAADAVADAAGSLAASGLGPF